MYLLNLVQLPGINGRLEVFWKTSFAFGYYQVILSLAGKSVARFIRMLFDVYGRLKSFMPFGLREVHVNSF